MQKFDVAILGAGPGGYSTALAVASEGLSVALIEKGEVGGTCLNRGCVPAKAWISVAETVDHAKHMATLASKPFEYSVDFAKMLAKQKAIVGNFQKGLEASLTKKGVVLFKGEGAFQSSDEITVFCGDKTKSVKFENAVIATGTSPVKLFDLPESLVLDNTSIFNLDSAPESMIIVGAGAIGCEFASLFSRLGTAVTLVELEPKILPMEDSEISRALEREFKKAKIKILKGVGLKSLVQAENGVKAVFADGSALSAKKVLVSVGRRFDTDKLGLDKACVAVNEKGAIVTDGMMRTSAPNIYATGDVAGKYMLAYTAYKEGEFVARVIAGKNVSLGDMIVPNAIFTIPEIGSVGVTEENAPDGANIGSFLFRGLARSHATGEIAGFVKVIADAKTDKVLGVHMIGARSTDLIHIGAVAMAQGMTAKGLGNLLFAHPTFAEGLLEAVRDVHGEALHK